MSPLFVPFPSSQMWISLFQTPSLLRKQEVCHPLRQWAHNLCGKKVLEWERAPVILCKTICRQRWILSSCALYNPCNSQIMDSALYVKRKAAVNSKAQNCRTILMWVISHLQFRSSSFWVNCGLWLHIYVLIQLLQTTIHTNKLCSSTGTH